MVLTSIFHLTILYDQFLIFKDTRTNVLKLYLKKNILFPDNYELNLSMVVTYFASVEETDKRHENE